MRYQDLPVRDCRSTAEIYSTYRAARQRLKSEPAVISAPFVQPKSLRPPKRDAFASIVTLQDIVRPKTDAQRVLGAVADAYGISVGDMRGPRRWMTFVNARHHAVSILLRIRPDLSLPLIGKLLNRDHTTIINARNRWPRVAGKFRRQEEAIMVALDNPPPVENVRIRESVARHVDSEPNNHPSAE